MNQLLFNFYDALFSVVDHHTLREAGKLTSNLGKVAQKYFENSHYRYVDFRQNVIRRVGMKKFCQSGVEDVTHSCQISIALVFTDLNPLGFRFTYPLVVETPPDTLTLFIQRT
ncbi:hypothetical protein QR680_006709 [Steinernema hermaphroditum]|uniref:Uncharacterized protein n=1 Tax=Steinernema hermaphroditum TaxID=289476 RepID=A0AA39LWY8_9BILA|nr:hypothetical protein QR680_006709 [Steinernema hermaphroditum]